MKILYIHNRYLQRGGEDTTVDAEMDLMRSKGHEVELLLFDNAEIGSGLADKLKGSINAIYSSRAASIVRQKIRAFDPDIVHVHNFYFNASPSVITAAYGMNKPVVVTLHNYRTICANCHLMRDNKVCELCVHHKFPWYGVKYKCYHESAVHSAMVGSIAAVHKIAGTWQKKVSRYITPAKFIMQRLVNSSLNVPAEKFRVKHNFIPDPGESPGSRTNHYLFVGRISPEKGVEVLLKAFRDAPHRRLKIVGDGPELPQLSEKYGQFSNIEFLGKKARPDVLELMRKSTALLFPSIWYEGLPLTIIESLATGTPVIASRLGAMEEMIKHGVNGMLFEANDPASLLRTIGEFEAMPEVNFNENARHAYLEEYHPDKSYLQIMAIYNELLS